MNTRQSLLTFALCAGLSGLASANSEVLAFNNQIEIGGLNPSMPHQVEIQLPNGKLKHFPIHATEILSLSAEDLGLNKLMDGQYKYQIKPSLAQKSARNGNEGSQPAKTKLQSGVFTIKNGQSVNDQDEESQTRDQQILDDLIVDGSVCVGLDCVNGESFGFDTIRLKENNLRIKFQDTSATASFPSNDWQITINDSSNGGANKFSIDDIDGGRTPFTIEASAPSHSLYVDDGGRIGFGTSTPVVENHISSGDTPTVRLEQNGTSGWSPQTWDMAGNESNFFIRDVTNGSKLPFRIQPGADSNSIYIKDNNMIGFGTSAPSHGLHLLRPDNVTLKLENSTTSESWKLANKGATFQIGKSGSLTGRHEFFDSGQIQVGDPSDRIFDLQSTGNLTIKGTLTQNSDVNSKENIQLVNPTDILRKVTDLPISVWNYKFDSSDVRHLGPMAQDFYKLFGLGSREDKIATLDTSGVALASIKALASEANDKQKQIDQLKTENKNLKERLNAIEKALNKLEQ